MNLFLVMDLIVQQAQADSQPGPLWILGQAGIIGAITITFGMLHRSAVNAYREVAAAHRQIAEIERKRADTANEQVLQLLAPIKNVGDTT